MYIQYSYPMQKTYYPLHVTSEQFQLRDGHNPPFLDVCILFSKCCSSRNLPFLDVRVCARAHIILLLYGSGLNHRAQLVQNPRTCEYCICHFIILGCMCVNFFHLWYYFLIFSGSTTMCTVVEDFDDMKLN